MKVTGSKIVYDGFFKVKKIMLEHDGHTLDREVFVRPNAAAALVYNTATEEYLLVKQYRVGAGQDLLEVVAGIVDAEDEDPEQTIRREVEEETGFRVDRVQEICSFYPSPGGFTEFVHLYYAEVSEQVSEGGGMAEEHENIELVRLTEEELLKTPFSDGKSIMAVQWLKLHKQKWK